MGDVVGLSGSNLFKKEEDPDISTSLASVGNRNKEGMVRKALIVEFDDDGIRYYFPGRREVSPEEVVGAIESLKFQYYIKSCNH